ncbi:MAG: hypothetical protein AAFO29_05620 [Actinomycetota bacterium]
MVNDASTSSTTGGEPPISWSAAVSSVGDEPAAPDGLDRRLGFPAADLVDLITLPDDPDAVAKLVSADDARFLGAYVPVVVHDTSAAERSYDAAEWAADLIRSAGGEVLAVATYAEADWDGQRLNARQWNHAAAMIERLDGVCQRFRLRLAVHETVGEEPIGGERDIDPERPLRYLLDTGAFIDDGFMPARLVSPERHEVPGGLVGRVRGLFQNRP